MPLAVLASSACASRQCQCGLAALFGDRASARMACGPFRFASSFSSPFEGLKNQIGKGSPVRWPGVAGVGEAVLLWMWRKPHAALVHLDQDRATLGPEFIREPDGERADAHRSRPFLLVGLIERGIEQPHFVDEHREVAPPMVRFCRAPAAWGVAPAKNCADGFRSVRKDRGLDAQGPGAVSQPSQHVVQRE